MNPRSQTFDKTEWENSLDRIIKMRFQTSYMSNSKWRRLFGVIAQPDLGIVQGIWKFVDSETPLRFPFPDYAEMEEGYIHDPAGVSPFKRIEWVEVAEKAIPFGWENTPAKHQPQDINMVLNRLLEEGQFEIEKTSTGLRVYGYR